MAEENHSEELSLMDSTECRLYTRRWLMLGLYVMISLSNGYMWVQYASIAGIVAQYYDVHMSTVDMMAGTFWVVYIIMIFPILLLLKKQGLKAIATLASVLHMAGAWIRFVGTIQHSIVINLIGQSVCGVSQTCCFGMYSHMAGTWFGSTEVSSACAIGFAGYELGAMVAFIIPPLLVHNGPDVEEEMSNVALATALCMSIIFILIIFVFEAKPPSPPSHQKRNSDNAGKQEKYINAIKVIMKNRNFVLLVITAGINLGLLGVIIIKLSVMVLSEYPDGSHIVTIMGVVNITAGMCGAVCAGRWLDRSKRFRLTTSVNCLLVCIGYVCFTLSLQYGNIWLSTMCIAFYGFFGRSFYSIAFEHAAELTYPESEALSSSIIVISVSVLCIPQLAVYNILVQNINVFAANCCNCIMFVISFILTLFIEDDNRRQRADHYDFFEEDIINCGQD